MKSRPPLSVLAAAWLLFAYGLLSLVRLWIFGSGLPSSLTTSLVWLVAIALFAGVAWAIYAGHNWARWLVAVTVALAVVIFPFQKPELPQGAELSLYALQIVMPIAAAALMFTPRATAWFQA